MRRESVIPAQQLAKAGFCAVLSFERLHCWRRSFLPYRRHAQEPLEAEALPVS